VIGRRFEKDDIFQKQFFESDRRHPVFSCPRFECQDCAKISRLKPGNSHRRESFAIGDWMAMKQ